MREVISIQYLRGLAASAVVFNHLSVGFDGPLKTAAAGVDVFFVISGFIMWVTTAGQEFRPQNFLMRRIIRIVPLYWIVTLATSVAVIWKPNFLSTHHFNSGDLALSMLFLPTNQHGEMQLIILQGWTLIFEMLFYIVFAMGLLMRETLRLWVISSVLIGLVLLQPVLHDKFMRFLANPILIEFIAGMILAKLWMGNLRLPLYLALTLLIAGLALFIVADLALPQLPRVIRWGVPARLVVGGSVFAERARLPVSIRALKVLGNASYSVYLCHVLVIACLEGILLRLGVSRVAYIALLAILTIPLSALLYFLIEKPMTHMLHSMRRMLDRGRQARLAVQG
ncbi:MAG: acyltransferase family protein [Rhodomicrobium sp.]